MGICFEKVGSAGGVGAGVTGVVAGVVAAAVATDDETILPDVESSLVIPLVSTSTVPTC